MGTSDSNNIGINLRVCVVGYGSIGCRHAMNATSLGAEVFFLRSGKAAQGRPKASSEIKSVWNIEDAFRKSPDVVIIANPTSLHVKYAIEFAKRNIHCFIEKPLSNNSDGIDELEGIILQNNLICQIGYMMRFDPGVRRLKEIVTGGKLGRLLSCYFEWGTHLPDWHPYEDFRQSYAAKKELGGGVVLTCSHELDLIRYLLGEVEEVCAYGGTKTFLTIDADECVDVILKHNSGTISMLHLDFIQRPGRRMARIIAEYGTVEWDFHAKKVVAFYGKGKGEKENWDYQYDLNEVYLNELKSFFNAVKLKSKPIISVEDGRKTLTLAQTILSSTNQGSVEKNIERMNNEKAY